MGLKVALEEMRQRGRDTPEKVVLLISDGLLDVNPTASTSNEDMRHLFRETLLPAYRAAGIRIITLALFSAAECLLLEEIALVTHSHFFYIPQAQVLSEALYHILKALKQPDIIPVNGQRLTVDPAVQETTFFIITDTDQEDVVLVGPDGVRLAKQRQEATVQWYVGKDYVLVTVHEPPAGAWHIDTAQPCPVKVAVVTDMRLEIALDEGQYDIDQAIQIAARLVVEGISMPGPLPLEELTFGAEVRPLNPSEGQKRSLIQPKETSITGTPSRSSPRTIGQWHKTIYTPMAMVGEHRGRVTATAPTFSREKSFAFQVLPSTHPTPNSKRASAGTWTGADDVHTSTYIQAFYATFRTCYHRH